MDEPAACREWQIALGLLPMDMELKAKREIQLSKNLNKLMKSRDASMTQIARRLGINKSTLHNYCNGVEPQGLATVQRLADYFQISVQELVYGEKVDSLTLHLNGQVEGQFRLHIERIK